jgi:beta-alanine--pyruvate transaminase
VVLQRGPQAGPKIVQAIAGAGGEMDYAPAFQMGHPKAFELANRLVDIAPEGMSMSFFTNSGSESVETALKIAIAYQRAIGQGSRTRLIGRERGYHGVNFGGISVGGIVNNRKVFGTLLTGVDHLPHTHLPEPSTPSAAASRSTARIWPTSWSASSRCTTPRPSPP